MWTLLSFTGSFDVEFLENSILKGAKHQPRMPVERTDEEKNAVRDAQIGRAMLRRGNMLDRSQRKLAKGEEYKGWGMRNALRKFSPKQREILKEYQSGLLRIKANNLTMKAGHGRLKKADGSFVDIGGSTGGFLRIVLNDWEASDVKDFDDEC